MRPSNFVAMQMPFVAPGVRSTQLLQWPLPTVPEFVLARAV